MTTILLTGAAGFIGFHAANALLERGDTVIGIDNMSDYYDVSLKEARLAELEKHDGFTFVKADIADKKAMDAAFDKHSPDKVCHLAAQPGVRYSLENPFAYEETNNKGTLVMLEQCRHKGVGHFIFASSSSVYEPSSSSIFATSSRTAADSASTCSSIVAASTRRFG